MTMYRQPNMGDVTDRLAHLLSEMHNDNAPIGWGAYITLARYTLDKFDLVERPKRTESANDFHIAEAAGDIG